MFFYHVLLSVHVGNMLADDKVACGLIEYKHVNFLWNAVGMQGNVNCVTGRHCVLWIRYDWFANQAIELVAKIIGCAKYDYIIKVQSIVVTRHNGYLRQELCIRYFRSFPQRFNARKMVVRQRKHALSFELAFVLMRRF